jgi:hypothetical protein
MGTLPFPSAEPEAWDTLLLAGRIWPGIAKVKVRGGRKIDRKPAPGAHGEKITAQGAKARDVDITIRCWTREQWSELEDAIATIDPERDQKKNPEPLFIAHPATATRGVANIFVENIEGPDWDRGYMTVHISAVEYFPSPKKNATSSPTGGKTQWYATAPGTEPTSNEYVSKSPTKTNTKP